MQDSSPSSQRKKKPTLTPMLQQYLDIKSKHPDSFLFFRMGDFYELFFEDAVEAAPLLEVQLTSRDKKSENPVPMAGVPHHSVSTYIQKLIEHGRKVAICDQVEDPAQAKGIVKREVTRVVTPALVGDPDLVSEESVNHLCAVHDFGKERVEICLLDLLAGEVRLGELTSHRALRDFLIRERPREILLSKATAKRKWFHSIATLLPELLVTQRDDYFSDQPTPSYRALLDYLKETQKTDSLDYLGEPIELMSHETMRVDNTTLKSLEILESLSGDDRATLFSVSNRTATAMGRRLLKYWLAHPLVDGPTLIKRHDAVSELQEEGRIASELRGGLANIRDLERLATKTALGLANPRDLVAIREIQKAIPSIKQSIASSKSVLLKELDKNLDSLSDLTNKLEDALMELAPISIREGSIFQSTYQKEIAEFRNLAGNAKQMIAAMEAKERNETQIPTLKIKFNKVFGYIIEISKSYLNKVPKHYIRKQTVSTGERYYTEELKRFEDRVISAEHKLKKLEEKLFLELRDLVAAASPALLKNARTLAQLDVLQCFAHLASDRRYVRPQLHSGWDMEIKNGRHPVVEALIDDGQFVPNSISFSRSKCRTLLLTGPNMAGKSTIMRQVALILWMAQAGMPVPAESASLPIVDAIFTRIGSADDLAHGRSTFMVEMTEMSRIIEQATRESFILIDEIGRGTSTYDGLSLAWSILETLHEETKAKTLFATHFHELTVLEKSLPQLKNANVSVQRWKDEIVFLHQLSTGPCNRSFGIDVAKLAHLPPKVLLRAREILGHLESHAQKAKRARRATVATRDNQLALFDLPESLETGSGKEV